jgi:hypothetical protein
MSRVTSIALTSLAFLTAGCPSSQVPLTISANVPAAMSLDVLEGKGSAIERCPTPCAVSVDKGSRVRVGLRAQGYLPAHIELRGRDLWYTRNATGREPLPLVIPLFTRAPRQERLPVNSVQRSEPRPGSLADRLLELEKLRSDGLISEGEYREKREQVLDRY